MKVGTVVIGVLVWKVMTVLSVLTVILVDSVVTVMTVLTVSDNMVVHSLRSKHSDVTTFVSETLIRSSQVY